MGVVAEHKTTIDKFQYTTETFPATEGLELIGALGGLLFSDPQAMSPVGELIMQIGDEQNPGASASALLKSPGVVLAIVGAVLRQAQGSGGLAPLAKQILERTVCANMKVGDAVVGPSEGNVLNNFDGHFAGNYVHLFKLCAWVISKSLGLPSAADLLK